MSAHHPISMSIPLVAAALCLLATDLPCAQTLDEERYVPHIITFVADHTILDLPEGTAGLVLESDQCYGCAPDAARWSLLGDSLRIARVVNFDKKYPLTGEEVISEGQLETIELTSAELVSALSEIKPLYLGKRIPHAKSGPTRKWDHIRQRWYTRSDLSTFYAMVLDTGMSTSHAKEVLEGVPGLKAVGYLPRAISDGFECRPGVDCWFPNDTGLYLDKAHIWQIWLIVQ